MKKGSAAKVALIIANKKRRAQAAAEAATSTRDKDGAPYDDGEAMDEALATNNNHEAHYDETAPVAEDDEQDDYDDGEVAEEPVVADDNEAAYDEAEHEAEDDDEDEEEEDDNDIQSDNEFVSEEEYQPSQDEQHITAISSTPTVGKPTNVATTGAKQARRMYPVDAFGKFAAVIQLIASAVQVDLEMVGSSLLGVIAALAQGLINVSSRASDSGCPVTLNMFVIAPSGERKSSTIEKIIKPVYDAIRRAQDNRKYMIVQDVTVDGLIVGLISRCPAQFLLVLEGASLLGGHAMSRDNLSRFLGNVASLYSGEAISRTRVNEHQYAQDRRLNVLLFTQPIVAMDFLSSEMVMQQGMGNRFLYSQPSSMLGQRQHTNIELEDNPTYKKFCAKIAELASMNWKINPETGGIASRTVRMTNGAKAAWVDLYNELEFASGPGGKLAPHAGYVTRFPEQVMRIAALLAMLEDPTVEYISEDIMVRAIELGKYYLDSAMRVFDLTPANKDEADAKTLLNWMQNKADEQGMEAIPVRMMYKDGPRCARPSKRTKELLAVLAARGEIVEFDEAIYYDKKNSYDNYAIVST